ncbi:hypothetical protein FKM82_016435 [Ascaphus truei]
MASLSLCVNCTVPVINRSVFIIFFVSIRLAQAVKIHLSSEKQNTSVAIHIHDNWALACIVLYANLLVFNN